MVLFLLIDGAILFDNWYKTTTGIQSGPDAFDKSRFIMTFLTILGATEILCSFKLFLEGKTGKEILSHQDYNSYKNFLEIILLYQMQKIMLSDH